MSWQDEKDQVAKTITEFPETFGLRGRGMPRGSCRISEHSSFVSEGTVWLVIQCLWGEGSWVDLCRTTKTELEAEIIRGG